jgi:hypothetical protein
MRICSVVLEPFDDYRQTDGRTDGQSDYSRYSARIRTRLTIGNVIVPCSTVEPRLLNDSHLEQIRFSNIKPKQKTHRFPNRISVPEQANWQPGT